MLKDGIDYELITHASVEDSWAIRVLQGDFIESVIHIDTVRLDDEEHMSFNFNVLETPDPLYVNTDNVDLQEHVADILVSVITAGLEEGYMKARDADTGEEIEFEPED